MTRRILWWCLLCGGVLSSLQPFIATHFRHDGWEDEPAFRVRSVGATVEYEPDDRADHPAEKETTIFVPAAASIDLPNALQHGLDLLAALVLMLLPLTIALAFRVVPRPREAAERVPHRAGAPPPSAIWRRLPPETAPPLAT
ncbi:MAG: hypothetical protein JWQ73_972 [Variovorax sp.]|nr:hypothetical protein [Variovorax sp.]